MDKVSEANDDDLILFVKNVLQSRALPINYKNLRDLVKQAPSPVRTYVEAKYTDEKFLNFLLSKSDLFSVSPDGSVALLGAVEFVFPQSLGLDTVDSVAAVSDDSYFGDREEYFSDSEDEEESNTSDCSSRKFLVSKRTTVSTLPRSCTEYPKESAVMNSANRMDSFAETKEDWHDTTSSSDSTQLYLSSETNSDLTTTTESGTPSSFESCDGVQNKHPYCNAVCTSSSTSLSYSSCSDS